MSSMSDWRDKDDLDLTAEDLEAMADAGEDVLVSGPSAEITMRYQLDGDAVVLVEFKTTPSALPRETAVIWQEHPELATAGFEPVVHLT